MTRSRETALPRKRSAEALALQRGEHRHRVIPDKRHKADDWNNAMRSTVERRSALCECADEPECTNPGLCGRDHE